MIVEIGYHTSKNFIKEGSNEAAKIGLAGAHPNPQRLILIRLGIFIQVAESAMISDETHTRQ